MKSGVGTRVRVRVRVRRLLVIEPGSKRVDKLALIVAQETLLYAHVLSIDAARKKL